MSPDAMDTRCDREPLPSTVRPRRPTYGPNPEWHRKHLCVHSPLLARLILLTPNQMTTSANRANTTPPTT